MIVSSENLSADDRNFLTQSQCGWENKTPLVKKSIQLFAQNI